MQKLGPGSYQKDDNLNLFGKQKASDSALGFGNGFISKADRGLISSTKFGTNQSHWRSLSVPRLLPNCNNADTNASQNINDFSQQKTQKKSGTAQNKCPPIHPRTGNQ